MTTKELITILEMYPPGTTVKLALTGENVDVLEVNDVLLIYGIMESP